MFRSWGNNPMPQKTQTFFFRGVLSGVFRRAVGFAILWWILTGGHPEANWYGVPVVIITALVSMAIRPARVIRLNLRGFARFLPFFFWQSLQGGFDVARRVMDPRLPISPSFLHYFTRLPDESARLFLAGTISLLPGTLSAELTGADLQVHILDDQQPALQKLRVVENRVAELFGSILTQGDESTPGETSS